MDVSRRACSRSGPALVSALAIAVAVACGCGSKRDAASGSNAPSGETRPTDRPTDRPIDAAPAPPPGLPTEVRGIYRLPAATHDSGPLPDDLLGFVSISATGGLRAGHMPVTGRDPRGNRVDPPGLAAALRALSEPSAGALTVRPPDDGPGDSSGGGGAGLAVGGQPGPRPAAAAWLATARLEPLAAGDLLILADRDAPAAAVAGTIAASESNVGLAVDPGSGGARGFALRLRHLGPGGATAAPVVFEIRPDLMRVRLPSGGGSTLPGPPDSPVGRTAVAEAYRAAPAGAPLVVDASADVHVADLIVVLDVLVAGGAEALTLQVWAPERPPNRPHVLLTRIHVVGALDKQIIRRILTRARQRLDRCYQTAVAAHPGLAGTANLLFSIDRIGHTSEIQVTGVDASLAACLTKVVAEVRFPSDSGQVRVQQELRLRPGPGVALGPDDK